MDRLIVNDSHPGMGKNSKFGFSTTSLQALFSSIPIGLIILEPILNENDEIIDFKWILCNKQAEVPFGRDLIGLTSLEIFPQVEAEGRLARYKKVMETGEPYAIEFEVNTPFHQTWVQLSASRLDENLMLCISSTQSQHALQESEERYRFLAESIPHMVYTSTPDGDIDYTNKKWIEYSDMPAIVKAEIFLNDCVHPDDREFSRACLQNIILDPREIKYSNRLLGKKGEYRWFENRIIPFKDLNGKVIKWYGTGTDIHDEKLILDKLQQTKEELENKNAVLLRLNADLDTFVYTASHDLTAPIANLSGLTKLLQVELCSVMDNEQQGYLNMMENCIEKLQSTIFDLTRMIQAETEKDLKKNQLLFKAIYDDITSDLQNLIEESNAIISYDFQVDRIQYAKKNLRTVMYNLLINAIKYRAPDRKPVIHISTKIQNQDIVLTVADNGMGIPANQLPKIFSIFNRLQPHIHGNGYGLFMIKRLVENNGGRIEVQSTYSEGTTFTVYFS